MSQAVMGEAGLSALPVAKEGYKYMSLMNDLPDLHELMQGFVKRYHGTESE